MDKQTIVNLVKEKRITPREAAELFKKLKEKSDVTNSKNVIDYGMLSSKDEFIAIIGMSGKFPKSDDLGEFWSNLHNGVDCVSEITRWDIDRVYDDISSDDGFCKRGGFLEKIDEFDAGFFEISPRQAEFIEPRQRIFLEEAWKAIEDAGYSSRDMAGSKCGVFVGCEGTTHYFDNISKEDFNPHIFLGESNSALSARISYFMNLKGPSMTIDTACSSSLVAIHIACESILNGDCETALAGGITVMSQPEGYAMLTSMNMLSKEGKCKTFDDSADGFVPGEGVGVLLLKKLSDAVKDSDHIYGIIRGSGINQDGKTNGLTAPSASSQTNLETAIYRSFKIDPDTISYIETHGTGTPLGDTIEVQALKDSFGSFTNRKNFCGLGSVKTNIGHAAAASGVAGVIKVLLALKNNELPKSLHFKRCNKKINFSDSPFYVVDQNRKWESEYSPRRAAISSFGHSGTNCHIVIEEAPMIKQDISDGAYCVIPVSVKNDRAYTEALKELRDWLYIEGKKNSIDNIEYTLQKGRTHHKIRALFIVKNSDELAFKVDQVIRGEKNVKGYWHSKSLEGFESELKTVLYECGMHAEKYFSVCSRYLKNEADDFSPIYGHKSGRKISMPTYPFLRDEFWINERVDEQEYVSKRLSTLIDENCSSFEEQAYKKTFSGNEFFIKAHNNVVPAVVYLEMVRQAAESGGCDFSNYQMQNVVFVAPAISKNSRIGLKTSFKPSPNGISFEIKPIESNNILKYVQGSLIIRKEKTNIPDIQIEQMISRMHGGSEEANNYYKKVGILGGELGERFRGLKEFYYNESQEAAIVKMDVVPGLEKTKNDYVIHPVLADAAVQGSVALAYHVGAQKDILYLPFMLESMCILSAESPYEYAYIKRSKKDEFAFDILYTNRSGKVLACIYGLMVRPVEKGMIQAAQSEDSNSDLIYYTKKWEISPIAIKFENVSQKTLVFTDDKTIYTNTQKYIRIKNGDHFEKYDLVTYEINAYNENDYALLFDELLKNNLLTDKIVFDLGMNKEYSNKITIEDMFAAPFLLLKNLCLKHWKGNILFVSENNDRIDPVIYALSGMANCLKVEAPDIGIKLLECSHEASDYKNILDAELSDCDNKRAISIRYQNDKRYVKKNVEYSIENDKLNNDVFKKDREYIITGGLGGIGKAIAKELCSRYNAKVYLLGRSNLDDEKKRSIVDITSKGGRAEYIQVDITNFKALEIAVANIKNNISGIIHLAAVVDDCMITKKDTDSAYRVLLPKINGIRNLDYCFRNQELDLFIAFSSTTATIGNAGQTDYGYANGFIDGYIDRMKLQRNNCRCIAMIWPLWENGGLDVSDSVKSLIYNVSGMLPLSFSQGIEAFFKMSLCNESNIITLFGNANKLKASFNIDEKISVKNKNVKKDNLNKNNDYFWLNFKKAVNIVTGIKEENIDFEQDLTKLGFDSIVFTELTNSLNDLLKIELTPAFFFGKSSLNEIAECILDEYEDVFNVVQEDTADEHENSVKHIDNVINESRFLYFPNEENLSQPKNTVEDIAIVGMDCIMPISSNKEEYWENLRNQSEMISDIPDDRWDWKEYYGQAQMNDNKTTVHVGGFMNEIDKFDFKLFNISPKEAIMMDPQERLILESVWRTLEDAGYKASDMKKTKTGVFIGVTNADYRELLIKNNVLTVLTQSTIANRVSYFYGFLGPSEPVDTACSSSLTAISKAIECIRSGECDYAIAGGVNVIASPSVYIYQTVAGMLSLSGKCNSFDESADGYVRGEGVGTVLLKPLSKAVKAGDRIYAVIRGCSINHGGHGTSFTTPNPQAQADVISHAYINASVPMSTVKYIEAHGTGTKIGDPIEINGLKMALDKCCTENNETDVAKRSIAVGTVKANIGHLESAAGISAVIKTVMSIRNKEILGVKGYKKLNPYIDLSSSPFYIAECNEEWNETVDEYGNVIPRRAGISSFGIGGVNVHLVLEEYLHPVRIPKISKKEQAFILSAKNKDILKQYVKKMLEFFNTMIPDEPEEAYSKEDVLSCFVKYIAEELLLENKFIDMNEPLINMGIDHYSVKRIVDKVNKEYNNSSADYNFDINYSIKQIFSNNDSSKQRCTDSDFIFEDAAYTLQTGREEMECRVAFVAVNFNDLTDKMQMYLSGEKNIHNVFSNLETDSFLTDKAVSEAASNADKWVHGTKINWKVKHTDCRVISLPNYPFERKRIWLDMLDHGAPLNKEVKTVKEAKTVKEPPSEIEDKVNSGNIVDFLGDLEI